MTPGPPSAAQRRGVEFLSRGQPLAARQAFDEALTAGQDDVLTRLGLAYASQALGDAAAAREAVDAALALDAGNLRALLLKGELVLADGDERAAAAFFQAALNSAPAAAGLPPDLQHSLQQAQATVVRLAGHFEATVRRHLAALPAALAAAGGGASARFEQSLDLLLGKKALYLQQPRLYCFPQLPHIQFFDRAQFPWLDAVEAATAEIREELLAVLQQPDSFSPYVERDPTRPQIVQDGLLGNPDWSAFYLWKNGSRIEANAARCPRTLQALAGAPMPQIPGRSPSILFSQLRPGARIPPHHGFVNTRLICHLPLIVPAGCGFRVGNETREWREGQAWVFDDTIEHEAWNRSEHTRVLLLFEIWRPELNAEERARVSALFEAIGQHQGSAGEWGI